MSSSGWSHNTAVVYITMVGTQHTSGINKSKGRTVLIPEVHVNNFVIFFVSFITILEQAWTFSTTDDNCAGTCASVACFHDAMKF